MSYDKFEHIRLTHPLRSTIPPSWPTQPSLKTLVETSLANIYMLDATVVIFVESNRRPPAMRLNVIPTKNGPRGDVIIMTAMTLKSVINVRSTSHSTIKFNQYTIYFKSMRTMDDGNVLILFPKNVHKKCRVSLRVVSSSKVRLATNFKLSELQAAIALSSASSLNSSRSSSSSASFKRQEAASNHKDGGSVTQFPGLTTPF